MKETNLSWKGRTEATDILWGKLQELQKEERAKGGVLDMETEVVSGLTAYRHLDTLAKRQKILRRSLVFRQTNL